MKKSIKEHKKDIETAANLCMQDLNVIDANSCILLDKALESFKKEIVEDSKDFKILSGNLKKNKISKESFNKEIISLMQKKMRENKIIYS